MPVKLSEHKMRQIKFILLDCMETIIDMQPVPSRDDYALWAYQGSGTEKLWPDYPEFLTQYNRARDILNRRHADLREDSFADRFLIMCKRNPLISSQRLSPEVVAASLSRNFLNTYYDRCFIQDDVKQMFPGLAAAYDLGIVSNFKNRDGIETMLEKHGLTAYFKFVLVSINFGRRKPHKSIYREAIRKSRVSAEHILFIGDDVKNDILLPRSLGMQTLLLDRFNKYNTGYKKINSFFDLKSMLYI
jgi:putative hydrolase of the HAD superfamily